MLIQVLGLREFTDRKTGKKRLSDRFFEKGWRFNSIQEVFGDKCKELVESIPEDQRFNLFYTAAHCFEDSKRAMHSMSIVPFDIDGIEVTPTGVPERCLAIARVVATTIGCDVSKLGVLFSGNGVQVIANIREPIKEKDYFDKYREHYSVICHTINVRLSEVGLQGSADPKVFDDARILRLPWTENRKKDKPTRRAIVIQSSIEPIDWDIVKISGVPEVTGDEVITDVVLKNYPKPDTVAVMAECSFIRYCEENQATLPEPQWYDMLSIVARLDDGAELCHSMSRGHPHYNSFETDTKIAQALASAGPKKCKSISLYHEGCSSCPHYGQIKSPIQIKGKDYIASSDYGFRERSIGKDGIIKPGKPAYDDIIKAFSNIYNYRVLSDTGQIVAYNGKHWYEVDALKVRHLVNEWIKPSASRVESEEALYRIKSKNIYDRNEMLASSRGFINFNNGVYDIYNNKLNPHGPEFGMFNVLPYNYDPNATCPLWDTFLYQIMQGDATRIDTLMKYAGYCLSYDSCWAQIYLVLLGEGSNGKSVFMEVLAAVVGPENASSIMLSDVLGEKTIRMHMVNKFFNYSDESGRYIFKESAVFKNLVQGGTMIVKKLYSQEAMIENRTKFIVSCNEMPQTSDNSEGFFRRMLIVPFNFKISPTDEGYNPFLKEDLIRTELPGIANKLIAAYKELMVSKKFIKPLESIRLVEEYKRENDTIKVFIEDCLIETDNEEDFISNEEIYAKYRIYCDESGYKPYNKVMFGRRFSRKYQEPSVLKRINGKVTRGRNKMKYESNY